jgi:hypothetical protein
MQRQNSAQQDDDLVFVERRRAPRIIVSIAGHYALTSRFDARGARREFACRIVDISLYGLTVLAPVNGEKGERVITRCDEFGRLEGAIMRVLDRGFVMSINATDEERARLAAKIEWYEKNKNHDVPDARAHRRIIPRDPRSVLTFADRSRQQCFIIDMSVSGAAISADVCPLIGTPLAVGKVVARVVRHFGDGFAVQFVDLQDIDQLEQNLIQV